MTSTHMSEPHDAPLGHSLARVLLRRWYAFLLPILVVPAAAFYVSLRHESKYEARSEVLVARPQLGSLLVGVSLPTEDPVRRIVTEREIANSRAVASKAAVLLGLPPQQGADRIGGMVTFSISRQADILDVSARSASRSESVRVANAAANAYTAFRRELEARSVELARRRTERALEAAPSGSKAAAELKTRLDQLAALDDLANGEAVVLVHAHSATRVAPRPVRTAEFGLGIGLLLGLALAYLAEALDRRVRSVVELGSLLRLPVVGELPSLSRWLRRRPLLPGLSDPRGTVAEAYRFLETNVALSPIGRRCRSILVTSAQDGEGKTTTALNFALAAAESGKQVLLLELDFRRPCLARLMGSPDAAGIAEIAGGTATLEEAGIELKVAPGPGAPDAGLTIAVAGSAVSNPLQYMRSAPVQALVGEARAKLDLVVLDVPSLVGFGDAMAALSLADGILLVVDFRHATRPRLTRLLEVTEQLPPGLIGVVANRAPRRPSRPTQTSWPRSDDPRARISAVA